MIPRSSCQDGCWAEPRGKKKKKKKKKLNLENKKLEKVKTSLTLCNKIDSYNPK